MLLAVCLAIGYLGIGILVATSRLVSQLIGIETLVVAALNKDGRKVARFKLVMSIAAVVIWPFFLAVAIRKSVTPHHSKGGAKVSPKKDLTFSHMGGAGTLTCGDCGLTQELVSFIHGEDPGGRKVGTSGYQCQACGKLSKRDYTQAFAEQSPECRIEHVLFMIKFIEAQMSTTPRTKWLSSWEPDLAEYRQELTGIPEDEIARIQSIRSKVDATFKASLLCECGGQLDRENILFCPGCRSKNLSYKMDYIT